MTVKAITQGQTQNAMVWLCETSKGMQNSVYVFTFAHELAQTSTQEVIRTTIKSDSYKYVTSAKQP